MDHFRAITKHEKIVDFANKALIMSDVKDFLDFFCKEITLFFDVNLTGILQYDIVSNEFLTVSSFEYKVEEFSLIIRNEPQFVAGYTFLQNKPVLYEDIKNDPKFSDSPLLKKYPIKSGLSITIKTKRGKWGVFGCMSLNEKKITLDDFDFFKKIAEIIGLFLERQYNDKENLNIQSIATASKITAGIAHDFNNYLSIINGYVNLLQEKILTKDSGPIDEQLKIITNISNTISKSTNLIKLIQLIGKNSSINYSMIDVNKIIVDMQEIFSQKLSSASKSDLKIEYNLSSDTSVPVKGDQTQFSQVLLNLVTNAIEASKQQGIIKISTRNILASKPEYSYEIANLGLNPFNYLHICVSDNGIGIDEEIVNEIFTPYKSGKKTSSTTGSNFGLGLSIVYSIIKQMNGEILVNSKPSSGTTFNIYLPGI